MLCLSRILFQFVELPVRVTFVPFYVTVQLLLVVPVYLLCQTFFLFLPVILNARALFCWQVALG